jgi:hypothetical protein
MMTKRPIDDLRLFFNLRFIQGLVAQVNRMLKRLEGAQKAIEQRKQQNQEARKLIEMKREQALFKLESDDSRLNTEWLAARRIETRLRELID